MGTQPVVIVAPTYRRRGTDFVVNVLTLFWGGALLMFAIAWLSDHTGALAAHPGYWSCLVGYWLFTGLVGSLFKTWKPKAKYLV